MRRLTIPNGRSAQLTTIPRKFIVLVLVSLVFCWSASNVAQMAASDLNSTFGTDGKTITDFFGHRDESRAITIQADGKIVVVGAVLSSSDILTSDYGVARYTTNGFLDATFGTGGKVTTDFSGSVDEANAVQVQSDGKIVVAGSVVTPAGPRMGLARYNTDGSLDPTFGVGGKATSALDSDASAVTIQSDGKIIVAGTGFALPTFDPDFALVRFNSNGTLDATFGIGGAVTTDFFGINGQDSISSVAVQPDGKIIAGGLAQTTPTPFSYDFAVARYTTTGGLDATFGVGGKTSLDFLGGSQDFGNDIALQPDGKIVAAGEILTPGPPAISAVGIARFNINGSLDTSFGSGGKVTTDFSGNNCAANAVVVQPDGKIIAAGFAFNPSAANFDVALVLLLPNGSPDSNFGTAGKVTSDFGSSEDARAVALQPDGKIVVAGIANGSVLDAFDFLVVRYEGSSTGVEKSDVCLQDESNGNVFALNLLSGEYQFSDCRGGFHLAGTGKLTIRGSTITLQHYASERRILVQVDLGTRKGSASVQVLSPSRSFTILDRNIDNSSCGCS